MSGVYAPSLPQILLWRGGLHGAVGGGHAWLASLRSPTFATPVGPLQSLIKRWLKVSSSSPAWAFGGDDISRLLTHPIFGRSRPPRLDVAAISGTSACRLLCPWPTQIIIPTTLAPKTGEVSWDSMGLRRVLFLAEVNSHPSKS
jgi:hypothetical protein